ncbi:hypothetical protein JCM9279_007007 [Rhodotorula babjevae]
MCKSTATLLYGLTLQALELCIAGAGYSKVKPALLAVDLIRSRKVNGTPERRTTACALPVELWDLVKRHILQQSYLAEWIRLQNLFRNGPSDDDCCCEGCHGDNKSGFDHSLTFVHALRGDAAVDDFMQDGGVPSIVNDNEKPVIDMLESFGLCLASLVRDGDKTKAYPHASTEIPHESDATHKLYRISPSSFVLPADADSRFRRLLSSFPALVPTSHTTGTIRPPGPSSTVLEAPQDKAAGEERAAKKKLSKEERRERDAEKKRAARVPGWMLVATGSTCM